MALSEKSQVILDLMREHHEGGWSGWGDGWASIYLDNARPAGMTARQFAGHLSALESAGVYKSQGDDCFGLVKIAD